MTEQVNYRCEADHKNRLIHYCQRKGWISYRDGVEHLLDLIEKYKLDQE